DESIHVHTYLRTNRAGGTGQRVARVNASDDREGLRQHRRSNNNSVLRRIVLRMPLAGMAIRRGKRTLVEQELVDFESFRVIHAVDYTVERSANDRPIGTILANDLHVEVVVFLDRKSVKSVPGLFQDSREFRFRRSTP